MKKLIDEPCENNINSLVEEHFSLENILILFVVDDDVDVPSTLPNKPSNKWNLFKK